jgi:hypothetical protein
LKLLRDESIESHVIGLTEECHIFKAGGRDDAHGIALVDVQQQKTMISL